MDEDCTPVPDYSSAHRMEEKMLEGFTADVPDAVAKRDWRGLAGNAILRLAVVALAYGHANAVAPCLPNRPRPDFGC